MLNAKGLKQQLGSLRFSGLGLLNKGTQSANQFVQQVKAHDAQKLDERLAAFEERETPNKLAEWMRDLEKKGYEYRSMSRSVVDVLDQRRNQVIKQLGDWYTATTKEEPVTMSDLMSGDFSLDILRNNITKLSVDLAKRFEEALTDLEITGRSTDYELRISLSQQQAKLDELVQAFWKRLGLVSQREIEALNRKLMLLANTLEKQHHHHDDEAVVANRRRAERRMAEKRVSQDQRVSRRREGDRLVS